MKNSERELHFKTLAQLFPEQVQQTTFANQWDEIRVTGICEDSRQIQPGDVFVARDGENFKGTQYISAAIDNGAVTVLVDQNSIEQMPAIATRYPVPVIAIENLHFYVGNIAADVYDNVTAKMQVIGVTGTNGKTSCAHYIAQALNKLSVTSFIIGTLGNGHPDHLLEAQRTTPDACALHRLFADFYQQGAKAVVMEVSSHALDQGRVQGVQFDVVSYTNLSRDHLDYHHSMQAYADAKARLFTEYDSQHRILNLDDEYNRALRDTFNDKQLNSMISYCENDDQDAAIWAENLNLHNGLNFTLATVCEKLTVNTQLLGKFNLANLLLCSAVLKALGFSLVQIQQSLNALLPVPGRMQKVSLPAAAGNAQSEDNIPMCVVDYAHTPDALEKALQASRVHTLGRLIAVFGCGGDRDTGKRAEMAKVAEQFADFSVVTSDNPRTENPESIIEMIVSGIANTDRHQVICDRKEAINQTVLTAQKGDVVLIAGKGHEDYQEIMNVKHPFLDAQIVEQALLARCKEGVSHEL
jgi:UDP-N-acetylmuramoyl-L-alanyl-D-glutamate--2,6-diaminopimelate ligase